MNGAGGRKTDWIESRLRGYINRSVFKGTYLSMHGDVP